MLDADVPPQPAPEPVLLIGWPRLLILLLVTLGAYHVPWYTRRARELAAHGLPVQPLAAGTRSAWALVVVSFGSAALLAAWPPIAVPDSDLTLLEPRAWAQLLDPLVQAAMTLVLGAASLRIARDLRAHGLPMSGVFAFILQALYLEARLPHLPGVVTRPWARADWRTVAAPAAAALATVGFVYGTGYYYQHRVVWLYDAGQAALAAKDLPAATRHMAAAVAAAPDDLGVLGAQVNVDYEAGRIAEGLARCEAAIALGDEQRRQPWIDVGRLDPAHGYLYLLRGMLELKAAHATKDESKQAAAVERSRAALLRAQELAPSDYGKKVLDSFPPPP